MPTELELLQRITMTRLDGEYENKPAVRDTAIAVERILKGMAEGETPDAILKRRPSLEPDDIQACLLYAYHAVAEYGEPAKWTREVGSKRRRHRTPEELDAMDRELQEIIDKASEYHRSLCRCEGECQCREVDIEVMLEQSGRGRPVIP